MSQVVVDPIRVVAPDDRPDILIGPDLPRLVDDAIKSLEADRQIYQRAGALVHVVRSADPSTVEPVAPTKGGKRAQAQARTVKRPAGIPLIRSLQYATLRERLSANARWLRKKEKEWVLVVPPELVVGAVAARGEWKGLRPLTSVVNSPTLRPDGSIIQTEGYDPATGLLYWPNADYPEVADEPSRDDAAGALKAIREVVCDFPFARPDCESAWIAALLTVIARNAIDDTVPMFAVDSTTRGTGKSRLVDVISRIAIGTDAARTSQPKEDEELRKRLTSIILEGDSIVLIDNVNDPIGGASLDTLLTSKVWKDRALGGNAMITLPNRVVLCATGNNLRFRGDLARRSILIRLESPLENPELREGFKYPSLLRHVGDQRHRLVACALTILRAFIVAGRPAQGCPRWGSFETWAELVPPAIVFAGGADPLEARATGDATNDGEKIELAAILAGLQAMDDKNGKSPGLTCKQIIHTLWPVGQRPDEQDDRADYSPHYAPMREAIESVTRAQPGKAPDPLRLGKYFQRVRGRVVGACRIERLDDPKTVRWRVVTAE